MARGRPSFDVQTDQDRGFFFRERQSWLAFSGLNRRGRWRTGTRV